jgi:RecB family endonuclease NucS
MIFLFTLVYNWQKSEDVTEEVNNSNNVQIKLEQRQKDNRLDIPVIEVIVLFMIACQTNSKSPSFFQPFYSI